MTPFLKVIFWDTFVDLIRDIVLFRDHGLREFYRCEKGAFFVLSFADSILTNLIPFSFNVTIKRQDLFF